MARSHKHTFLLLPAALVHLLLYTTAAKAQTNNYLLNGNRLYEQQNYKGAQQDYLKALQKDPNNTTGLFNLGNTLYQQKQYDSSRKVMAATAGAVKDKKGKAAANYNIGNSYMSQQKWEEAANAYKQTLRNNPQDVDAKYNLSYAEQMMKKQQDQQKQQDKKNQQNKDQQKQQNKDQGKDQKDKDKQDKGQNNQDKQNDQNKDKQQQPEGQPGKLSQQQADQLLDALQQEEKKLQDKMKKEKGTPAKLEKDW